MTAHQSSSRAGGKGVLTGWDVTALRCGVGALIALSFEAAVIAWLWLKQAPSRPQRIALVFAGIVLTAADMLLYGAQISGMQMVGDLLFLCASSSWATFTLLMAVVPGLSALAAVPVLDEPLSLLALAGLAAVTAGAVLGARQAPKAT